MKQIGHYEENYYKRAGLQVGDEIIAMDGIPYSKISKDTELEENPLKVDILRNGKVLTLYVEVDHNEPKGD